MVKILELHSTKVRNTLNDVLPPQNNAFNSKWYDNSGNNNHGVLNALYYFDNRSGWLGSYNFDDYYNLFLGYNSADLTVPTLYNTNFPQDEGTLFFVVNFVDFSNTNYCNLFGNDAANSTVFARIQESNGEYGIQCGIVGSDGLYKAIITFTTAENNRILLNSINRIAIKYKTGIGGYFALFINGVKVAQVNLTSTTTFPSSQTFKVGKGTNKKKIYYVRMDNIALTDEEIIEIQNTEWKTVSYSLPILNKNYVAWGDSITWTCANGNEYPNLTYHYIRDTYGKIKYYNKGIGGATSSELVNNLNSFNCIDGDIVTIGIGMNDCANQGVSVANYKTNLGTAIDFIRSKNSAAKIILCTPSGTSDVNRAPYIADYRTAMEEVATAKSCYLCKFHEAVTDENIGSYSSDGIHPNKAGHVLLMAKLQPIIDEILI